MSWWTSFRDSALRSAGLKKSPAKIGAVVGGSVVAANSQTVATAPAQPITTAGNAAGVTPPPGNSLLSSINFSDPKMIALMVGAVLLIKNKK